MHFRSVLLTLRASPQRQNYAALTKWVARGVEEFWAVCDHSAYFQILRWFFTQYPWKEVVLDQCLAEELRHVYERSGAKGFSLTKCFARGVEELRAVCDHSAISKYSGGFSPYIYWKKLCVWTNQKNSGWTSVDRSTKATLSTYNTWIHVSRLQKIYHFQSLKLRLTTEPFTARVDDMQQGRDLMLDM